MDQRIENLRVSVIVPVYNGEKYLPGCLEDLGAQTLPEVEIILVDDGSTDGSPGICDRAALENDRIRVIHQKNQGPSAARNAGIRIARGEYVLFLDVDDRFENYLAEYAYRLAKQYDADVVMYSFRYRDADTGRDRDNGAVSFFVGTKEEFFHRALTDAVRFEIFHAPWNKLIRRSLLEQCGLCFDPSYHINEDILFAARLLQKAQKLVITPKICYTYFVRSSGSLITKFRESFFESVTAYYREAMRYCDGFENNRRQICSLTTLYDRLVILHLKQIALNRELPEERKKQLIEGIIRDPDFRKALGKATLPVRKMAIKMLIYAGNADGIIFMYNWLERWRNRGHARRIAAKTGV
ncbi:MAG: glycosyltransferase [Eubacterium sp.]|nr:glycosyltransferase [Eubacterium sp.]